MEEKSISVELRAENEKGKNINRRLRNDGLIPAIIYSHGEADSIKMNRKDFINLFDDGISEGVIFDVNITNKKDDTEIMAYVKDYQVHPVTGQLVHVDLFKVTKGEKIHTSIPIEIIGVAAGTKLGAVLEVAERSIEIECLPKNLPSKIDVDVTELLAGDSIHAKDLELGADVKLLTNPESVIAACHTIRAAAEDEEEEEGEGEETEETEETETKPE